jgi:hypothetical protein
MKREITKISISSFTPTLTNKKSVNNTVGTRGFINRKSCQKKKGSTFYIQQLFLYFKWKLSFPFFFVSIFDKILKNFFFAFLIALRELDFIWLILVS